MISLIEYMLKEEDRAQHETSGMTRGNAKEGKSSRYSVILKV